MRPHLQVCEAVFCGTWLPRTGGPLAGAVPGLPNLAAGAVPAPAAPNKLHSSAPNAEQAPTGEGQKKTEGGRRLMARLPPL